MTMGRQDIPWSEKVKALLDRIRMDVVAEMGGDTPIDPVNAVRDIMERGPDPRECVFCGKRFDFRFGDARHFCSDGCRGRWDARRGGIR